nr:hypothetical protein BaRGS_004315 [Batillaria attramentaria]
MMKKIKKLIEQVKHDEDVFKEVMGHRGDVMATQCTWVIALPNVARQREDLVCTQTSDMCQKYSQEFLLGLDSFRTWYVGIFSTPSTFTVKTERSHVRDLSDTIRLTGRLVSRLLPTKEQEAILKTTKERRVHLVGAPCTGKTMLLVLKARNFAEKYKDSVIIVVNMHEVAEVKSRLEIQIAVMTAQRRKPPNDNCVTCVDNTVALRRAQLKAGLRPQTPVT